MARTTFDTPMSTRATRGRLAARHQPYWRGIEGGSALGYRKSIRGGTWLIRLADPAAGGGYRQAVLGRADDAAGADGETVLDFQGADRKAREWLTRQRRIMAGLEAEPVKINERPITVAEAMASYAADYATRGGKAQQQTQLSIKAHILPQLGAIPVTRLTRAQITKWRDGLANTPRRTRQKASTETPNTPSLEKPDPEILRRRRASVNRIMGILKAALNHARAAELVECRPDAWADVKPFAKASAPKVRYLSDAELTRLVNASPKDFRLLVTAALMTGCRYGELTSMRVADYDAAAQIVVLPNTKSGKPRHVFLTDEGHLFFNRQVAGRPSDARMFERNLLLRQATRNTLAVTERGPWGRSQQDRFIKVACAAAKITPAVSFHILRHTYASRLAMRGATMAVIAAQLGHSDTRMTEKHYAHLAPSYVADAIRATFGTLGIIQADTVVSFQPAATAAS